MSKRGSHVVVLEPMVVVEVVLVVDVVADVVVLLLKGCYTYTTWVVP